MNEEQIISTIKNAFNFLELSDIKRLLEVAQYKEFKNKEIIITDGVNAQKTFMILSGMVRGYYINDKGEEKNIFLRPELTITGAPDSLFKSIPTKYTFESILETKLLLFDFKTYEELAFQNPNLAKLYARVLQENIQTLIFRIESITDKIPEERYIELLERSPQFFQTAFNKHIANYLGITPVSLSRIIKRLKERNN